MIHGDEEKEKKNADDAIELKQCRHKISLKVNYGKQGMLSWG